MPPESAQAIPGVLSADFYTSSCRVVGTLMVHPVGIMAMINDPASTTLEALDAHLAWVHMPSKLVGHYESVHLVKSQIFAIAFSRRIVMNQPTQPRNGYVPLKQYLVMITSSVYELQGSMESTERPDISSMLESSSGGDFFPLYDATLNGILIPALQARSPAILFNRRKVDMLALSNQKIDG